MASVQELIDAANAQKSPFISALEGLASGYLNGQQQALERTKTLVMLEQNRREQEQKIANQKRIDAQYAKDTETARTQALAGAATKPDPVLATQKLDQKIVRKYGRDAHGNRTMEETFTSGDVNDNSMPFQKFDYVDENGKTRSGMFDRRTGRYLKGMDDPLAPVSKNSESEPIKKARDLRKEFLSQSKEFFGVNESMARIRSSASDPSAAGDLALIFNYMKVLDPGSVVRESEFATAQNAAGVPDRIRAQYNRIVRGERLSPDTRTDFVDRAERLFEGQSGIHAARVREYRRLADSVGADPNQVIVDPIIESRDTTGTQSGGVNKTVRDEPTGIKILRVRPR